MYEHYELGDIVAIINKPFPFIVQIIIYYLIIIIIIYSLVYTHKSMLIFLCRNEDYNQIYFENLFSSIFYKPSE